MRISINVAVIACAWAGLVGEAAAQYYPPPYPQPYSYRPYGPPPYPYPPGQNGTAAPAAADAQATAQPGVAGPYGHAPYVYRDGSGYDRDPYGRPRPYDPRYDQQAMPGQIPGPMPPDRYGPARRPYFVPDASEAPQGLPAFGGDPTPRPPADIGGGAPPDATGAIRNPAGNSPTVVAALPPEDQPEQGPKKELPPQFRRQFVDYVTKEPAGTIVIDTPNTFLYLVLGNGKAMRYGIGVGREGFTWSGAERVSRMSEWPDWHPPKEMIERQPYLPRFMAGGEGNPLGARALYLGHTLYRIHGTNQPSTIGTFVSSGCIRLTNEDIEDLYGRVNVGTRVVVLPGSASTSASAHSAVAR